MRKLAFALALLLSPVVSSANVQIGIGISFPGVNIGISVPTYPRLVRVPNYPVYYDPYANSNYFFYDGLYWVFRDDRWYASSWYNGPWRMTGPEYVPLYVLRVPVRYYRRPPAYFHGWHRDAPPHWGEHWGHEWERHRVGWDHWDHHAAPAPAPLPVYQRQYSGDRYPRAEEQQHLIRSENYHYQSRDAKTQHFQQQDNPVNARPDLQRQMPVQQDKAAPHDNDDRNNTAPKGKNKDTDKDSREKDSNNNAHDKDYQ